MRSSFLAFCILLGTAAPTVAQIRVGIGIPSVTIGINLPLYPELEPIPGYPVYYAPQLGSNYFFYDGLYWVYAEDRWYASSWYDGPWDMVAPEVVPLFVLRVPVRYYRRPPEYFRGWGPEAPPRWGEHWGHDWQQRRPGWDHWDHAAAPARAPLPTYQRQFAGDRYPRRDEQQSLRSQNYHYAPRSSVARQQFGQPTRQASMAPARPERADRPPVADQGSSARRANAQPSQAPRSAESRPAAEQGRGSADRRAGQQRSEAREAPRAARAATPAVPPPRGAASATENARARPEQRAPSPPAPTARERPAAERPQERANHQEPRREPDRERDH